MIDDAVVTQAKEVLIELLRATGFEPVVETEIVQNDTPGEEQVVHFNITIEDPNLLIGQYGAHLQSLQHIARILVRRKVTEPIHFVIDVNEYKKRREEYLRQMAKASVQEAQSANKLVMMKPMLAYERRIVHAELAKFPGVVTESVGEEPNRRIVIKVKK